MKIKKILLLFSISFLFLGCTDITKMSYEDALNTLSISKNSPNTYKKGFSFYTPKGLAIDSSGTNYVIFYSNSYSYYMYVDFVSYINKVEIDNEKSDGSIYYEKIDFNGYTGYIDIVLKENNKYLIEIMYNYAKIEVMVEEDDINKTIINSLNILGTIEYKDKIIEDTLNDDSLDYTEEYYQIPVNKSSNSNILDYALDTYEEEETVKDTDYID